MRSALGAALLALVSCAAALALAEAALRIAGVRYPVFDTYDSLRGMALRPYKEGWYRMEGESYVRINSAGYRDAEHSRAKPPGTFRIAVLGDSFVDAKQVDAKETFLAHLASRLGGCEALGGRRAEALNFGVGGYNTSQALLTLRHDVLRFSPDLVLLAFFAGNDVHDNSKELSNTTSWRMPRPFHVLDGDRLVLETYAVPSIPRRALFEGVHHLRLLEVANQARRLWTVKAIKPSAASPGVFELGTASAIYGPPADTVWREAWRLTEALLAQMNREALAGLAVRGPHGNYGRAGASRCAGTRGDPQTARSHGHVLPGQVAR